MKAQREAWPERLAGVAPDRLIFLDDSGAQTDLTRLYGRASGGTRGVDVAPRGHWCTTTMLSSIRLDGSKAAMVVEGPTDGEVFGVYVDQVLVASLRPGDIVVMDNLAPRKMPRVVAAIEAAGAEVGYLPPYSPDLNPIEKMWSKVRQFLHRVKARTQEALWRAIGPALETVTDTDAANWFRSCGYCYE